MKNASVRGLICIGGACEGNTITNLDYLVFSLSLSLPPPPPPLSLVQNEPVDFAYSYPVAGFGEQIEQGLGVDNLHTVKTCLKCCVHPSSNVKHMTDDTLQPIPAGSYRYMCMCSRDFK